MNLNFVYWSMRALWSYSRIMKKPLYSPSDFYRALYDELSVPLTSVSMIRGDSMAPTLNPDVKKGEPGDKLVIFKQCNVFEQDVVAFRDPENESNTYVRRVVGLPGEMMESSDPDDDSFVLENAYWLVKDNDASDAPDSRDFGPVSKDNIVGRVILRCRSKTEHERVENSKQAGLLDSIILDAEQAYFKSKL